jgi:hypothetical protein
MKPLPFMLALALTAGSVCAQTVTPSFVPGTPADEAAIRAILAREETGDRSQLPNDLDWENAFGIRYRDEKKRTVFYHATVDPLQTNTTKVTLETRIEFVTATVAIADVYGHRVGQIDQTTGKTGADRWGRNTYVFKKENGAWIEVAERVADLRYNWYKHYDTLPAAVPVPAGTLAAYAGTYASAPGQKLGEIAVEGDHLIFTNSKRSFTAIPTSATVFLAFRPEDLAEYYAITFGKDTAGKITLSLAHEGGDVVSTATKTR